MSLVVRQLCWAGCAVILIVGALVSRSGLAVGEPSEPSGESSVFKIKPGQDVTLSCETNAVGMDFSPFKTTTGVLNIELSFHPKPDGASSPTNGNGGSKNDGARDKAKDGSADGLRSEAPLETPDPAVLGTWTGSVAAAEHAASFGTTVGKICSKGCVLRRTSSGDLELWSPRPIMPSKLKEDERLTIATLSVATLEIKATSFKGEQLSILEKGLCEVADP